MQLQLSPAEQQLLTNLVEERYRTLLIEIRHTDSYSFKQALRDRQKLMESVLDKVNAKETSQA